MRSKTLLLLLALAVVCSAAAQTAHGPEARDRSFLTRPAKDITGPLEALLRKKRGLDSTRIRVDWARGEGMISAELFGSGVGIWNERVQFRLPRRELLAVLGDLREARFGSMPGGFGEETDFLRMRGKMSLTIGAATKGVVQLETGPQSERFRALAEKILRLAERSARGGVSAASLADGLAKIAAGKLAPEALDLVIVRREENLENPAGGDGSMLAIRGRAVRARVFQRGAGYGPPRRLWLSEAEARKLAALLAEGSPSGLPPNLYSPEYTDLHLAVLQWKKDLQARRYLGVGPRTHGARQDGFDRIAGELARLFERTLEEGREESEDGSVGVH
jgi:hypothetical protein